MATSPLQGLPYPALPDAANGPTAFQNLALAVEKKLVMTFASSTARTTALPNPTAGMVTYVTGSYGLDVFLGGQWVSIDSVGGLAPVASAKASTYPFGTSIRVISNDATWPLNYGIVRTERTTDSTRCVQTFTPTTADGLYTRYLTSTPDTWSAWSSYVANSDTGWISCASAGITPTANFTSLGGSVRRRNGTVHLAAYVTTTNAIAAGNITNINVVNLPAGWAPPVSNGNLGSGGTGQVAALVATPTSVMLTANTSGYAAGNQFGLTGSWLI